MPASAITFETHSPAQIADPARMDVACFFGFIAERAGAELTAALVDELKRDYGLTAAELSGANRLLNRPVPVTSVQDFEALFEPDARLEQRAVVEGGTLAESLPGSGIEPFLFIVIDGIIHEVALDPLPLTPAELVTRIENAALGLEVGLTDTGGLRLALPLSRGAGQLAVQPHPAYGFPDTRRGRARAMPSVMGQAVRQFFAMGGRKAVIVRMGDPIPYDTTRAERFGALIRLMTRAGDHEAAYADAADALALPVPPPFVETAARYGIAHSYGLEDSTFLLLPDLPELVSPPPQVAAEQPAPRAPEAAFVECLPAAADLADAAQSAYLAPVTDSLGHALWTAALDRTLRLIRSYQRDKILIAALPRFGPDVAAPTVPESAFLQLAETWVRTDFSTAAPGRLMAPDAVLAGHLANATLIQGTYLSAAIRRVAGLRDIDSAAAPSALPTCRIERMPRGYGFSADLTTSRSPDWADGPVSRLMALLLRQAREIGADLVFQPNGRVLWAQVEEAMRGLLEAARRQGALAGEGEGDSYTARCDATTMSQQDLDAGRLICEVSFRPTIPVNRIRVRLPLGGTPGAVSAAGGPA